MRIIVDVMSGDNAPLEPIKGAVTAAAAYKVEIIMVGDEKVIAEVCADNEIKLPQNVEIVNSDSVITMEDHALSVVREKADSSMGVSLRMLADGKADAMVSAGNTGALHAGSTLVVRRIKGIKRSAISTILPFENPTMLIDSGANTEVTKDQLEQFGMMGSIYMKKLFNINDPRVGLANIGTEPTKGTKALVEAYEYLSRSEMINFIGNVEGKQLPFGVCDVIVCDGFTGNTILKVTEGIAMYVMKQIKGVMTANPLTKLSALTMKHQLLALKASFSASEYGGAPMLGISKPVIKAHGSSDAEEIKNSVRQAIAFLSTGLIFDISEAVAKQTSERAEAGNE
ncbi:MAG: phosphate acyltransferase PlsX [Clostridia bacterium]|nr:phosphate acyltransferase PlsX [Clostridia bacterium]